MTRKQISGEALIDLHRRLRVFPPRSHDRRFVMQEAAKLYGVSEQTLYRALRERTRPKLVRRTDRGAPRILPQERMERYCELIAAMKVRTSNKKAATCRPRRPSACWKTSASKPRTGWFNCLTRF
jgi:hypothetical protein